MSHSSSPRAEQHATRAAFFMPGFAIAAWAPIVPFAKANASLDEASLGIVLLCLGVGSLLAMPLAGAWTARLGCRRVMLISLLVMCLALPLLGLAHSAFGLGMVLFVFGAGMGAMDCAMNMQAVAVERDSGKVMMSGFHAFYSIGGLAGAAAMTLLLGFGIGPGMALLLSVGVIAPLAFFSARHWHRERITHEGPLLAWPRGVVLFIGVLTFIVFLAEGTMLDWSAVFLSQVRGVDASLAGTGFVVFSLTMTTARLFGDRLVARFGRHRSIILGSVCGGIGFGVATLVPVWEVALLGYGLVGLGCSNIVPALFSMAGQQRSMPPSIAIPAVTTLGYMGVLAGPAAIGFIAHASSLLTAFILVAVMLLAVAISARWLRL
ncbi:MFS transporter [Pseudomonas sp. LRF_L74]|uniref:MFS transporter n=1 Tax=Pseudomonas sp. LRF_L74 TaxID=3369422 RepID=UPI003F5E659C